jgi:hypothetical protein
MPEARLTADERREWSRRIRCRLIAGYFWTRTNGAAVRGAPVEFQAERRLQMGDEAMSWVARFVVATEDCNQAHLHQCYPGAAVDWSDLLTWLRVNAAVTDASVYGVTFGSEGRRRLFNRRIARAVRAIKRGLLDAGEPLPDWPLPPPLNKRFLYPAYLRHMARHSGWDRADEMRRIGLTNAS